MSHDDAQDTPTSPDEFITPEDARRIQSHADRTGTNQAFKRRAMSAAAKHEGTQEAPKEPDT